jgi:hypothetical protein
MRYPYTISILSAPCVKRHCSRCGEKKPFVPSDQIRINAQKKLLDVWLIHRCRDCGQTWNMEVFARISPKQLDRETYDRLLSNDPALILAMAFDAQLHARKNAPLCRDTLEYEVHGERLAPSALTEPIELSIECPVPLGVRLDKLLREILELSAREFEALVVSGRISSPDAKDLLKARMERNCTVRIIP